MSSAGNMFVSKYGVWGSTTVAVENNGSYEIRANAISPMVNVNFLDGKLATTVVQVMNNETTAYNVLGLKRIIAAPVGTSNVSANFQNGDIILYYT